MLSVCLSPCLSVADLGGRGIGGGQGSHSACVCVCGGGVFFRETSGFLARVVGVMLRIDGKRQEVTFPFRRKRTCWFNCRFNLFKHGPLQRR